MFLLSIDTAINLFDVLGELLSVGLSLVDHRPNLFQIIKQEQKFLLCGLLLEFFNDPPKGLFVYCCFLKKVMLVYNT